MPAVTVPQLPAHAASEPVSSGLLDTDAATIASAVRDRLPAGVAGNLPGTRVLVTGATGLIGQHLMRALAALGAEPVAAPRDLTAPLPRFTHVIHGAGYSAPRRFTAEPLATLRVNTAGLLRLLDALPQGGRLLYLSSSEVCSGSAILRHQEHDIGTTSPQHARGCYIEAKRCGEAICHAARAGGVDAMIARVSLCYGPGVGRGDTRAMNELITQAVRNGEIVMQDGGQARRTYCYVTDVAEMLINIMLRGKQGIYNVAGEGETTVLSLARRIAAVAGARITVPRGLGVRDNAAPQHVTLDTGRYRREFQKTTWVPLDDGIARTIAWHRELWAEDRVAVA